MKINEDIYTIIAKEKLIETLIDKYNVQTKYKQDLAQEIYLIILTKPPELLKQLYDTKQINYYLARIISNQYFSKTSQFFKNYKKYNITKSDGTNPTELEIIDE